jgi:hypothetical protein
VIGPASVQLDAPRRRIFDRNTGFDHRTILVESSACARGSAAGYTILSFLVRLAAQLTWTALVFGLITAVTAATGHGVNWSLAVLLVVISVFYAWARGYPPRPGAPPNAWLLRLSPRLDRYLHGFRSKSEADTD